MKVLSRDFTTKEKVLLLVLVVILIGLVYFQFVYKPITASIEKAENQKENLKSELEAVNTRITMLTKMKNEVDDITTEGTLKAMPSYNNSKNVNKLLNDVLGDMDFALVFSPVEKDGDQIRRRVQLTVNTPDADSVKTVFSELTGSEYRCLIENVSCAPKKERNADSNEMTIVANLTFFETMVGGKADAGLPVEEEVVAE